MSRPASVDAIVVGLGAMGSATTLRLARRGLWVVGIDRFHPPHDRGSTHGETRITRLAIGEGSDYTPLVRRSHELWQEIEREAATTLLHQTGGLVLGPRDDAFLEQTRAAADLYGIAHENLSNNQLKQRFPMFVPADDTEAYFEPEAGFVRVEAAVTAQLSLAGRAGAELRLGEVVNAWDAADDGVTVTTSAGTLEAHSLVLCAGAWIARLFPEGSGLFAVYPQLVHWFPIRHGYEGLRHMPVFVWEMGGERSPFAHGTGFYGLPPIDGPAGGVKIAAETYEATIDPDAPRAVPTAGAAAALYRRYLARHLPWLEPEPLRTISCLYTTTRASRFVIDRHPNHANVVIVSACSGHGFKHSAAIGEAVAETIVDGSSGIDLGPFAIPGEVL